jgi:hypothetical protein
MLDVAQPKTRARAKSQARTDSWGIVDGILALVMLPFGIWMLVIEGLVDLIAWLLNASSQPRRPTGS